MTTIPLLFAAQIALFFILAQRSRISFWVPLAFAVPLAIWGIVSGWMSYKGLYNEPDMLGLLPGLWLPMVPLAIAVILLLFSSKLRRLIGQALADIPNDWLVAIQVLRIAAIGTLIKTIDGTFPLVVVLAIGLSDLMFGLSAIGMLYLVRNQNISNDALMVWHAVGILVVAIPGGLALQTNLNGPLLVPSQAPVGAVLDFPMALAPSLVVPTFLMLNILGIIVAYKKMVSSAQHQQS